MSVNANLRIRRGEIIRISVAPFLGIEVARIDITPKHILAVDRMNKRYVEVGFSEISGMLNTELDFNIIQSLMLNEIFLPGRIDCHCRMPTDLCFLRQEIRLACR